MTLRNYPIKVSHLPPNLSAFHVGFEVGLLSWSVAASGIPAPMASHTAFKECSCISSLGCGSDISGEFIGMTGAWGLTSCHVTLSLPMAPNSPTSSEANG